MNMLSSVVMVVSLTSLPLMSSSFTIANPFTIQLPPSNNQVKPSALFMSDDFPSDSSVEDVVDVESTEYEATESENIISSILDVLPSNNRPAVSIPKEARSSINEALLKLEAMNPTLQPTTSPLLNGVWSLRYAGGYEDNWALPSPTRQIALFLYSGGYSPGVFALSLASSLPSNLVEIGDLEIAISRDQPRIEANIDVKFLGGTNNDIVVKAALDSVSDVRLTETYESASVLGQAIDLPQAVQYSRDLYVTYLDDDVLVVRDGSGVPEILVRKK